MSVTVENNESKVDEEVFEFSIKELLFLFWDFKFLIALIVFLMTVSSLFYAYSLRDIYRSETILAPRVGDSGGAGGMGGFSSQLGGLANLAGVNLNMGGYAPEGVFALETLKSRRFFADYLYKEVVVDLFAVKTWDEKGRRVEYKTGVYDPENNRWVKTGTSTDTKPSVQAAYSAFKGSLIVYEDIKTGYIKVSMDHFSPVVAREWILLITKYINEDSRLRAIEEAENAIKYLGDQRKKTSLLNLDGIFSRLIEEQTKNLMLANIKEQYVFQVVEPPVVPEGRISPQSRWILIFGFISGVLMSIFVVLAIQSYRMLMRRGFFER